MPSNLAAPVNLGKHSTCLIRVALLNPDCTILGGPCSGYVNAGIITATATPVYRDDRTIEPTTGCGGVGFSFSEKGPLLRETLTGELMYHDYEMKAVMFGGQKILGAVGGPYAGKVIGWAPPSSPDPVAAPVYLEIITRAISDESGTCVTDEESYTPYVGHIFGRAQLTQGALTFNDQNIPVPFDGVSEKNPNLGMGPWLDWPGAGVIPSQPIVEIGYSQEQWEDILALAAPGCQDLPQTYS